MEKVKIIEMQPNKVAEVKTVDKSLLSYQTIVNDCIAVLTTLDTEVGLIDIYMGDNAIFEDGRFNRMFGKNYPYEPICAFGPCFAIGFDPETGDNISLTKDQINYILKKFKTPHFVFKTESKKIFIVADKEVVEVR